MTLKQALPILTAIDASEPWQFKSCEHWFPADNLDNPIEHLLCGHEIRLAPKPEKWAAEKAAFAAGKALEYKFSDDTKWRDLSGPPSWVNYCEYRVKPEPTYIPLGPGDVPPGSAIRKIISRAGHWNMVASVSEPGVKTSSDNFGTWETLFNDYEILIPGETEWKLCRKESK